MAQYQTTMQPSFDTRTKIGELEADVDTTQTNATVVKAVVADKKFVDISALYEKTGYMRKSVRASRLTRKTKAAVAAAKKQS